MIVLYFERLAISAAAFNTPFPSLALFRSLLSLREGYGNIHEGWVYDDDTLPASTLTEPLPDGVGAGVGLSEDDLSMMVSAYYHARGWDEDGTIPADKLGELGLGSCNVQ